MEKYRYPAFNSSVRLPENVKDFLTKTKRNHTRGIHTYNPGIKEWEFSSYGEIYREATKMATMLIKMGISPGERVLISAETTRFFPPLWVSLILAGAVPVPLPPAKAFFTRDAFLKSILPLLPYYTFYFCAREEEESIRKISEGKMNLFNLEEMEQAMENHQASTTQIHSRKEAFVLYDFREKMEKRGLIFTYDNLLASLFGMWSRLRINPSFAIAASWLPLYRTPGLTVSFLGSLFTGMELYLIPPEVFAENPGRMMEILSDMKINFCSLPFSALRSIIAHTPENVEHLDLSALVWLGIDSWGITPSVLEEFEQLYHPGGLRRNILSPYYTVSEVPLGISLDFPRRGYEVIKKPNRIYVTRGQGVDNMEIRISPENSIALKGTGVVKEALLDGKKVPLLDDQGYYKTGDSGFFQEGKLILRESGKSNNGFKPIFTSTNLKEKRVS